jgi:hypothetical protein
MKRIVLQVCALLLMARFVGAGEPADAFAIKKIKYTSPRWKFSVLTFPVLGQLTEEPINEPGMTGFRVYSHLLPDVAYAVTVFEMPREELSKTKPDGAFDEYLGQLKRRGGQLVASSNITLDAHPGRQYVVKRTSEGDLRRIEGRVFLVGNRFYVLEVSRLETITDARMPVAATAFLDAFRLQK